MRLSPSFSPGGDDGGRTRARARSEDKSIIRTPLSDAHMTSEGRDREKRLAKKKQLESSWKLINRTVLSWRCVKESKTSLRALRAHRHGLHVHNERLLSYRLEASARTRLCCCERFFRFCVRYVCTEVNCAHE